MNESNKWIAKLEHSNSDLSGSGYFKQFEGKLGFLNSYVYSSAWL